MASPTAQVAVGGVSGSADDERGYRRAPELQRRFEEAVARLEEVDSAIDPETGRRGLRSDLVLEGGGVKGIGLVGAVLVLDEAGYGFARVAGTSAGAIAAALVAAITRAKRPMTSLKGYMDALDFGTFQAPGLGRLGERNVRGFVADTVALAELSLRTGLSSGDALVEWLGPILEGLDVRTFADLRLERSSDPAMSLEPGHRFRLLVHTADITRKLLVRLPWDYPAYGHDPDGQRVVDAVRASMSIPFYFKPVVVRSGPARVPVPTPDGGTAVVTYEPGAETWVDGGMLKNFPIDAFARIDGRPPRWPTIGIKLSLLQQDYRSTSACRSSAGIAAHSIETMLSEWDSYSVDQATAARTIFVDNAGVKTTDFALTQEQKLRLFTNGVLAATQFVIEMAEAGGVPRTADAGHALVVRRRCGALLDLDHPLDLRAGRCATCGGTLDEFASSGARHLPVDAAAAQNGFTWLERRPLPAHGVSLRRGRVVTT